MTPRRIRRIATSAALASALLAASSCSLAGLATDRGTSPTPAASGGPTASVEQARARVLSARGAPSGLKLLHLKRSEPTPGADAGWRGGWTTQSLVLPPGAQHDGWEWAQSTVNVYANAASAASAFDVTKAYAVSTYAGNARETDPGIGDSSVAIEATRNVPDVTVLWREDNLVVELAGYGGPPLTNDDVVDLARALASARMPTAP